MLEKKIYEKLKKSTLFCERLEQLEKFLSDGAVVSAINSIEICKLDFLLDRWCETSYNDPYIITEIKNILQNQRAISIINSIDMERLRLLNFDNELDTDRFIWFMENEEAQVGLNSINVEKFAIFVYYDADSVNFITKDVLFNDHNIRNAINNLDKEKFKFIYENGKFNGLSLLRMFENPDIVDAIGSIDIERFEGLIKRGKMCMELLGKKNLRQSHRIELVINDDKYYHLKYVDDLVNFGQINIRKLRMIVESDLFDSKSILKLIKTEDTVFTVNSLDDNKFAMLFNHKKETWTVRLLRTPGAWYVIPSGFHNLKHPNCISMYPYRDLVLKILLNHEAVVTVNSMDVEKLTLLLNAPKNSLHYARLGSSLQKPTFCNFVNSVDVKKLEVLLDGYNIDGLAHIAFFENSLKFIELINDGKLKIVTRMNKVDFIKMSKCCEGDTMKNLYFAIALCKVGVIKELNYDLVLNTKLIMNEVKKLFPKDSPIDQILWPSSIKNQGSVLNLKYLCLEALISQGKNEIKRHFQLQEEDILRRERFKFSKGEKAKAT